LKNRREYEQVLAKQGKFLQKVKNKRHMPNQEAAALGCKNFQQLLDFWNDFALGTLEGFDSKHVDGWKRWTRGYQGFSSHVMAFLQNMKPILDSGKAHGGTYVGDAIGIVALLFVVSRSHGSEN
jgi:hypothetical protein